MDSENQTVRSRAWCYTINNPEDSDYPTWSPETVSFSVYQLERGENGTPHIQGYVRFTSIKSFRQVKALLPRAHIEVGRGSPRHNYDYCTKLDDRLSEPVVLGDIPQQGKRTDLIRFRDSVSDGWSDAAIIRDDELFPVYARHPALAERIRFISSTPRFLTQPPDVHVYIGKPGSGKTSLALERFPDAYWKPNNQWWPLYSGQDTIVFEDFNGSACSFTDLKCILDRGPFIASVKNGHTQLVANRFIITTNFAPKYWYSSEVLGDHGEDALLRRITKFVHFKITNGLAHHTEIPPEERETFIFKINTKFK